MAAPPSARPASVAGLVGSGGSAGHAAILFGGPNGVSSTPTWTVDGSETTIGSTSAGFGSAVDGAGDFNGDGFDDIAVGAPDQTAGTGTGRVYVHLGGTKGLSLRGEPLYNPSNAGYGTIVHW